MKRAQALAILSQNRDELRRLGVESLSIVGSVARDEPSTDSDIDLLVKLVGLERGFAHFRRLDALQARLSEILGCRVDLIEEAAVSQRVRFEVNRDRVRAF